MTSISVQDPYILEHNTSANVSEKMKTDFIRELSIAQNNLSQTQTDDNPWGLSHLITEKTSVEEIKTKVKSQNGPLNLILPINVDCLNKEMEKSVKKFDNTRILWCKMMCSFLQVVLKDMLLIECCVEKEQLSLKELLKPTETLVQDKTSVSLSSDLAVVRKDEPMEDKEAVGVLSNANNADISSSHLQTPAQIYQKRQSDEYISGEVKRICLKEQETFNATHREDFNWPECSGMAPPNFENAKVPKLSVTSCKRHGPDKNTPSSNNRKEIIHVKKTSTSNAVRERTSMDEVSVSDTKTKSDEDEDRQQADSDSLLQMLCTIRHYTWRNRKKTRQKILPQWNGCDLEFEKKISEHIVAANETDILKPSLTTFRVTVTPEMNPSVCVHIYPVMSTCKEVLVFYQFLSSYITRMVSTHFLQWCITTSPQRFDFSESDVDMSPNKPDENADDTEDQVPAKD